MNAHPRVVVTRGWLLGPASCVMLERMNAHGHPRVVVTRGWLLGLTSCTSMGTHQRVIRTRWWCWG